MIPTVRIQHKVTQFRFDGLRPTTLPSDGVVDIVVRVPVQDMRVDDVDGPLGPSEILGDLTKPSIPGDDGESYFSLLDIFVHLTELQYLGADFTLSFRYIDIANYYSYIKYHTI